MKRFYLRSKGIIYAFLTLLCTLMLSISVSGFFNSTDSAKANSTSAMPTNLGTLADNGTFNSATLTALAKSAGYDSVGAMITAAKKGNVDGSNFKRNGSGSTVDNVTSNGVSVYITVKVNNSTVKLEWIPVYLTKTNDTGHAVLDLWLAVPLDSSGCSFGTNNDGSASNTYPSSMYGTSKIRSYLVGSNYATSATAISTSGVQNDTMKAFINTYNSYLDTPSQIDYQETESAVKQGVFTSLFPNDAYGTPSSGTWAQSRVNYTSKGTNYTCWSSDKIWLPSQTETGYAGTNAKTGIWNLKATQLSHSTSSNFTYTVTRSGGPNWNYLAQGLQSTGDTYNYCYTKSTYTYGVRPAIHLDLDFASPTSVTKPTLSKTSATYTGSAQTFTINNLNTTAVNVTLSDTTNMSRSGSTLTATNAGTYTITFALTDTSKYVWSDGSNTSFSLKITISPKGIATPTVATNTLTYNGSAQNFTISNLDTSAVDVSPPSGMTYSNSTLTATNAGTYKVTFSLKNKTNYKWSSDNTTADKTLTLTINKYSLSVANTTLTYTGNAVTVGDFSGQSWYKSGIHNNTSLVVLTFDKTPVDAGTYTATFTLQDTANYKWSDSTAAGKSVTLTVAPKPITVTFVTDDDGKPTGAGYTLDESQLASKDRSSPPTVLLHYTKINSSTSLGSYDAYVEPTDRGTYKVMLEMDSSVTNYALDSASAGRSTTFEIPPILVSKPSLTLTTAEYDGTVHEIEILSVEDGMTIYPAGKLGYNNGEGGKYLLTATNVGTYSVSFVLNNDDTHNNYAWSDGTGDTITQTITITPKVINLTFEHDGDDWELPTRETESAWAYDNEILDADYVEFNVAIVYLSDNTSVNISTRKNTGKKVTFEVPSLEIGEYKIVISLADSSSNNVNGNYTLTNSNNPTEQGFTVIPKEVGTYTVIWQYVNKNKTVTVSGDVSPFVVNYNGSEYTFSIVTKNLAENGLKIKGDYSGDVTQTAVSSNNYCVQVTLEELDSNWADFEQTYTLYWKIDKGKIDFSGASWNYGTAFVYNGELKNVELTNLPSNVVANYELSDATGKVITAGSVSSAGTYTTKVSFVPTDSQNYYQPVEGNSASYTNCAFDWSITWQIDKDNIELIWVKKSVTNDSGTFDTWELQADGDKVEYTYYNSVADSSDMGDEITLNDIVYTSGITQKFYVEVSILAGLLNNYQFSGTETVKAFYVGDDLQAVILTVTKSVVYNGQQHSEQVVFISNAVECTVAQLNIQFFDSKKQQLADGTYPINAGTYTISVSVKPEYEDQYFIKGSGIYTFEVKKYQLDLSDAKWGYTDDENNDVEYTQPFVYEIVENSAVEYSVKLINLTGYAATKVGYTNTCTASSAGIYSATYNFNAIDTVNYEITNYPAVSSTLKWQIKTRQILKPVQTLSDITFDGDYHNLVELCVKSKGNLPTDWQTYLTLTAYKNGAQDGTNKIDIDSGRSVYDVGEYTLKFDIRDELVGNVEWIDENGITDSVAYSVFCNVLTKEIVVSGWYSKPRKPEFTEEVEGIYYDVIYTDPHGMEISESYARSYYGVELHATVKITEGMEDNVKISTINGATLSDDFICYDPLFRAQSLAKPALTSNKIEYTGYEINIIDYLDSNYIADKMNVAGTTTAEKVGDDYTIYISISGLVNAAWDDGEVSAVVLNYSIIKADIALDWDTSKKLPTLKENESLVDYVYYDENGNRVDGDDLELGVQYYITAEVKDEYKDSYGFGTNATAESEKYPFKVTPPVAVAIPTMVDYSLSFNGQAQSFALTGVDNAYVEYNVDELTQTEAGVYYVTVSLKSGTYAVWGDSAGGTGTRRVEFAITKKAVEVDWDMSGELPSLNLHGVIPNTAVTYKYYDTNGKQVANNSLKEGETYIIKGVIDDEYAKNYMFGDSADTISDGQEFTYTKGELSTTSGSNSDVIEIFGGISKKWLTIIAIILLVLCIIGILLWLLSTRRRHDAEDRFLTVGGNGSRGGGAGHGGSGSGSGSGSGKDFQDTDGFYDDYVEPKG